MREVFVAIFNWLKNHKFWLGLVVVALIGGGVFAYFKLKPPNYETATVARQNLTQMIEVSGEIDAEEKVDLHFQALGKLNWIGVKEGDKVNKWQVIATQDARSVEKNLRQDLITFEQKYREHDQARENWEMDRRTSILRLLETDQGELNSAVLDVEIRNLSIELSRLITPIAGVVTAIDTPVAGVNVIATDSIEIVNPDTLFFEAEVDETDIALLKAGQKAKIVLDAYEESVIDSEVTQIDFQASTSESGGVVFMVKLLLPEKEALIYRLGMNGEVSIVVDKKEDVLAIPIEAIKMVDDKTTVRVLTDGKVQEKEIETGIETDELIEVTSGLTEGEVVITGEG